MCATMRCTCDAQGMHLDHTCEKEIKSLIVFKSDLLDLDLVIFFAC